MELGEPVNKTTCTVFSLLTTHCRLYSKVEPLEVTYGMGIKKHDMEGRLITCEYENFFVVTACELDVVMIGDRGGYVMVGVSVLCPVCCRCSKCWRGFEAIGLPSRVGC